MAITIIAILFIFFTYNYLVLCSDSNQIELLKSIYQEYTNEPVQLANSAVTNFITKKEFKDKDTLISLFNDSSSNTILEIKYTNQNKILTITKIYLNTPKTLSQQYQIHVGLFKLYYTQLDDYIETMIIE